MSSLEKYVIKPSVVGGICVAATSLAFGEPLSAQLSLFGMQYPLYAGVFLAGAGSSIVADLGSDYLFPGLSQSQKMSKMESMLAGPGINGAALAGIFYFGGALDSDRLAQAFALGAVSEISGVYVHTNFVSPYLAGMQS